MELVKGTIPDYEYETWKEAGEERDRLQKMALENGYKLTEVRYGIRHGEEVGCV